MKTIPVSYLRECFEHDEHIGSLTWRRRPECHFNTRGAFGNWNTKYAGRRADIKKPSGYRAVAVRYAGRTHHINAHRVIWAIATGAWPRLTIDHIDGDKENNLLCNLRDVSTQVNLQNKKRHSYGKAGLLGVTILKGRYMASIKVNRKTIYLGSFDTAEEAHQRYVERKRELHEGCTI